MVKCILYREINEKIFVQMECSTFLLQEEKRVLLDGARACLASVGEELGLLHPICMLFFYFLFK